MILIAIKLRLLEPKRTSVVNSHNKDVTKTNVSSKFVTQFCKKEMLISFTLWRIQKIMTKFSILDKVTLSNRLIHHIVRWSLERSRSLCTKYDNDKISLTPRIYRYLKIIICSSWAPRHQGVLAPTTTRDNKWNWRNISFFLDSAFLSPAFSSTLCKGFSLIIPLFRSCMIQAIWARKQPSIVLATL